jgi:SAM-dependent methyltransferase
MDVVERLTLEAAEAHSLIAVEHVHRYELSAELCTGLQVADVGCGSGYGSEILRRSSSGVTGVDSDPETIKVAQALVGREADVSFVVADAHEFLRRNLGEEFDAIVLFEVLEHLEDPDEALASLRQLAAGGLRMIISIPNSKAFGEENPYHQTDYGFEEAMQVFRQFGECTVLFQFLAEGSLIRRREATEAGGKLVATERGEPESANHFIACVNFSTELERLPDWARMHLEAAPLHNRHVRNLERANHELRSANVRLARSPLGKADSAAATLLGQRRRDSYDSADLTERQVHLRRIEELHEQALALERQLQEITATRSWRLATRYWAARDGLRRGLHLRNRPECR